MDRRTILKALGTGVATTGLSSTMVIARTPTEKVSVTEYEKRERNRRLRNIKKDERAKELVKEYRSKGWRPEWNDATCKRTVRVNTEEGYDFAVVPFATTGNNDSEAEEAVLLWIGNDTTGENFGDQVFIHHVSETSGQKRRWTPTRHDQLVVTQYTEPTVASESTSHGEKSISSETVQLDRPADKDDVETDRNTAGEYCKLDACFGNPMTWSCFAQHLIGLSLAAEDCALCITAKSAKYCLKCIVAVGATVWANAECLGVCETKKEVEIRRSYLNDRGFDCADYATTNDRFLALTEDAPYRDA